MVFSVLLKTVFHNNFKKRELSFSFLSYLVNYLFVAALYLTVKTTTLEKIESGETLKKKKLIIEQF